jgi:hypothetical protein
VNLAEQHGNFHKPNNDQVLLLIYQPLESLAGIHGMYRIAD